VVKRGAEGASALAPEGWIDAPATRVPVVDSTGAGDAFIAGFVAGWLDGRPMPACLALGNACGAVAVGRVGGAGRLPDLRTLLHPQSEPVR
jgi:sugar/nucleoside kinase (ribokinase family)